MLPIAKYPEFIVVGRIHVVVLFHLLEDGQCLIVLDF